MDKPVSTQVFYEESVNHTRRACLKEVTAVNGRAVTLRVVVDEKPGSGYASLATWDGDGWTPVFNVEGACLLTPHTLATRRRKAGRASFKADLAVLLRVAKAVL